MSQQPYPAQYPQAPAQQYPQQPQGYQPQAYPAPAPQQYQGQPTGYAAPQIPQGPPPAQGSLDAFYSQPTAASGPSISWSVNGQQKPIGTAYAGIVARDVLDADVQQDSDPKTQQLKTYRDGRPKFFMKVPLRVQPSPEFPEGEATWYVRGQARDELARAMAEAGVQGSPKGGDAISITLVDRRQMRGGGNPANIVQVSYQPAASTGAPSPAPVQEQAPAAQPVQQALPSGIELTGQPQPLPQAPQYAQPVTVPQQTLQQNPADAVTVAQQVQQQPEVPAQPVAPAPPAGLDPEQAALLAKLTGQA